MTLPFSEAMLRRYAGERSFDRGWEYYVLGRVADLSVAPEVGHGRVAGSQGAVYAAEVGRWEGRLQWRCDCPVGERGELCKHAVAVALQALHGQGGDEEEGGNPVRTYLESLDHGALVDLLLEQAAQDETLATRLEGAALAESEPDADRLRLFVAEALDPGMVIGWEAVSEHLAEAESVEPLSKTLSNLVTGFGRSLSRDRFNSLALEDRVPSPAPARLDPARPDTPGPPFPDGNGARARH